MSMKYVAFVSYIYLKYNFLLQKSSFIPNIKEINKIKTPITFKILSVAFST